MRCLPLLLLALALPALAEEPMGAAPDAGVGVTAEARGEADGGTPALPLLPQHEGVGRHFAYVWDMVGPEAGMSDVQVWVSPRWGRATEAFTAVDLRAGMIMGLRRGYGVGFFLDATPEAHGNTAEPAFDGRATLHLQDRSQIIEKLWWGSQVEVQIGLHGAALWVLLGLDAQLSALRLALNIDGWTDAVWYPSQLPGGGGSLFLDTSRFRQSFGFSYALPNGFSVGVEMQNRLSWRRSTYVGDAFYIGPSFAYRGETFWVTVALLGQVAAVKTSKGGDPLELTDNERFGVRISTGLLAR